MLLNKIIPKLSFLDKLYSKEDKTSFARSIFEIEFYCWYSNLSASYIYYYLRIPKKILSKILPVSGITLFILPEISNNIIKFKLFLKFFPSSLQLIPNPTNNSSFFEIGFSILAKL